MKIEINVAKKHIAILVAAMLLISALTFASFVFGKTAGVTDPYADDKPFHDLLYVDTMAGKTGGTVTVDDDLVVTGGITGEGVVPSGFCIFSATINACPAGWVDMSGSGGLFNAKTIRGDSGEIGAEGGAEEHQHKMAAADDCDGDGHCADNDKYTNKASSWPPYRNVIICCRI